MSEGIEGRATLLQLLLECVARADWNSSLAVSQRLASSTQDASQRASYLLFAGTLALDRTRDLSLATSLLMRAFDANPGSVRPVLALLEALSEQRRWAEMDAVLQTSLKLALARQAPVGVRAALWQVLGRLRQEHFSDPEGARLCFEKAAARSPSGG